MGVKGFIGFRGLGVLWFQGFTVSRVEGLAVLGV